MRIKPITSEADYDEALTAIDDLMGAEPDTLESDELEVVVTLAQAYEAEHWPIEAPDPISATEHFFHGGARFPAEGLREPIWVPAACIRGAQPQPSAHTADDPRPVRQMEPTSRRSGTRIRSRGGHGALSKAGLAWCRG